MDSGDTAFYATAAAAAAALEDEARTKDLFEQLAVVKERLQQQLAQEESNPVQQIQVVEGGGGVAAHDSWNLCQRLAHLCDHDAIAERHNGTRQYPISGQ